MDSNIWFWIAGAYFIGSIPFGLLLGFLTGKGDIRKVGSGNIGATNMMRAGGKKLAALTLILDGMKGFLITFFASRKEIELVNSLCNNNNETCSSAFVACHFGDCIAFIPIITIFVFSATILGHIFPIWLKFKGGKGVATFLGGLFGLHWMAGLVFILCWVVTFKLKRISALSAIIALIISPLSIFIITQNNIITLAVACMSALIIYRHKDNIKRLLSGNELGFTPPTEKKDPPIAL